MLDLKTLLFTTPDINELIDNDINELIDNDINELIDNDINELIDNDINELIDNDINTTKELFNVLQLDGTPESTERLGNRNEEKKRRIRIKPKLLNEKKMAMGSLGKLKTAPENVTDDYTIDERDS